MPAIIPIVIAVAGIALDVANSEAANNRADKALAFQKQTALNAQEFDEAWKTMQANQTSANNYTAIKNNFYSELETKNAARNNTNYLIAAGIIITGGVTILLLLNRSNKSD